MKTSEIVVRNQKVFSAALTKPVSFRDFTGQQHIVPAGTIVEITRCLDACPITDMQGNTEIGHDVEFATLGETSFDVGLSDYSAIN